MRQACQHTDRHINEKAGRRRPGFLFALLLHLDDVRGGLLHIAAVYLADNGGGQLQESAACQSVFVQGGGTALVAALADALHNGYLPQQRYAEFVGRRRQPSLPKM